MRMRHSGLPRMLQWGIPYCILMILDWGEVSGHQQSRSAGYMEVKPLKLRKPRSPWLYYLKITWGKMQGVAGLPNIEGGSSDI